MLFFADSIAGADVSESHDGADIPSENFLDVFALVGVHLEQAANALMLLCARVQHRLARLELSGEDTDKRQLTVEGIGHDFEGQRREWLLVVSFTLDRLHIIGIVYIRLFGVQGGRLVMHSRLVTS